MDPRNVVCCLLFMLTGCNADLSVNDSRSENLADVPSVVVDYEKSDIDDIYSTLLRKASYPDDGGDVVTLRTVTFSSSEPGSLWGLNQILAVRDYTDARWKKTSPPVAEDLKEDFFKRNVSPTDISVPSEISDNYIHLTSDEMASIFADKYIGWDNFHSKFPRAGIIDFSKIGFNKDRSQALVFMSKTSGPKNGVGDYYVLAHRYDGWHIEQIINAWVS